MKKSLLLAAAALFGFAPQASALVQLTKDNCATEIKDGVVLALQCLDTNGGLWKFWNGPGQLKSETINPEQGLLQVEFNGDTQRGGRQTFYLRDFKNPGNYLANASVTWTTDKSAAAVFTAYVPTEDDEYASWVTKPIYLDVRKNTVRFDKGGSYLNTQNEGGTPNYAAGKGGYSYWFAYAFSQEDAAAMTADNAPKMITCHYAFEDPKHAGQYNNGMQFAALEGADVSAFTYLSTYEGNVDNFSNLELKAGENYKVSEENNIFKITMDPSPEWMALLNKFDADYNSTYKYANRATIKPDGTEAYISYSYLIEGLRSGNTHKLFGASHMWYLDYVGLDMRGNPLVKFMSVQKPGYGIHVKTANVSGNTGQQNAIVTEDPTVFSFYYSTVNGHQEKDFTLGATNAVTSNIYFLNKREDITEGSSVPVVSTWQTGTEAATGDNGSLIRFLALEDSEFDAYQEEVVACGYPEYLKGDGRGNGVDISDAAFEKAKATKLPEDVTKLFPENVALLLGLRSYLDYTGLAFYENRRINGFNGEEDFYGIPGYVQDGEIVNLYNALDAFNVHDESTWTPVAQARWNLVNAATQPAVSYDITPGAIFNMVNVDSDRGYLVNDEGVLRCSVAQGHVKQTSNGEPIADNNFHFTFVKVGENLYMYNLGAEKFMNAFGPKSDRQGAIAEAVTDHTWVLADVPTIIRGACAHSGDAHAFSIAGGMTSGTDDGSRFGALGHEGGITMMANCERGVLVTLGNSNREDGSGLKADYVGSLTDEEYQAIVAKAEAALAAVPMNLDWSEIEGIVNHVDEATLNKLNEVANSDEHKAVNGGAHDHVNYVFEQEGTRQGFEAGKVYNFFVDATNALKVDGATGSLVVDEFDPANTSFNLQVVEAAAAADVYMDVPETKAYNFLHTIEDANGQGTASSMSYNGSTEHLLDMSELGKVKLNGETFIAKAGTGAATTGIAEINATDGTLKVYDLQGRKLAAPAKGINIINGKKTLVK